MAHKNTILNQVLDFMPRHEFDPIADEYHMGQKFRNFSHWGQLVSMTYGQLTKRVSYRDLINTLESQQHHLYHLGITHDITKSTLARVNAEQPAIIYEKLFEQLLPRCQRLAPKHKFRFKNKLYSMDATVIDLCLSLYGWAKFRQTKAAVKLHVGLDHDGYLPTFIGVTKGKVHDINWARKVNLPPGSISVFDLGYLDYGFWNNIDQRHGFFVSRAKTNTAFEIVWERPITAKEQAKGLIADQTIRLTSQKGKLYQNTLRRVVYYDHKTQKTYIFLTNILHLAALTIAAIYKERWQIELFFKWIKQNLRVKNFYGTSRNAVLTQIWIALCVYLILALMKFKSKAAASLQTIVRLLQVNLMEKADLISLITGASPPVLDSLPSPQLALF